MATVYLAVVAGIGGFNKLQVVKQLRAALAAEPEFLKMFLEEARLAARINHPNVVQTYEVGYDGRHHFISMEYLEGQSLQTICEKLQRGQASDLSIPMRLRILAEALAGLHHAHELTDFDGKPLNVVHRDVSPHNIIVTYDGHVKLVDFGIAKAADSSDDTRTGVMKGKCAYMAIERYGGKVDRRSDIFSGGAIMWHLLTGERLWKDLSDAEIFKNLVKGDIQSPRAVDPSIPEALEQICMKALAANAEDRYQTAADFQTAIEDYLATASRVTARDVGLWLSKEFSERRAKIKATIEEQLKAGQTGKDGPLPTLEAGAGPMSTRESIGPWGGDDYLSQREAALAGAVDVAIETPRRSGRALRILGLFVVALAVAGGVGVFAIRQRVVEGPNPVRSAKTPTAFGNPATPLVNLQLRATSSTTFPCKATRPRCKWFATAPRTAFARRRPATRRSGTWSSSMRPPPPSRSRSSPSRRSPPRWPANPVEGPAAQAAPQSQVPPPRRRPPPPPRNPRRQSRPQRRRPRRRTMSSSTSRARSRRARSPASKRAIPGSRDSGTRGLRDSREVERREFSPRA
jgi:serine/threonine protein kinase